MEELEVLTEEEIVTDDTLEPAASEETSVSAQNLVDEFKKNYDMDIDFNDITILMELKERIDKENCTNIYAELPKSVQKLIRKSFSEAFNGDIDINTLDTISSVFLSELFSSAELDGYIKEFNDVMGDISSRVKEENITNDAKLDEVFEKVTKVYETTRELVESEPDTAERGELTYNTFMTAITLENILKTISERPSVLNRAYKESRNFKSYAMSFDRKFCCGESNVKIRTLEGICYGLQSNATVSEEFAKTICILIANEVSERNLEDVYDKWYVYYMSEVVYLLHKTTLVGDVSSRTNDAITSICNQLNELVLAKASRKGKGKKRG